MKPKFELGSKLYLNFYGYWQACWPVSWFYKERFKGIVYALSDSPYNNEVRYGWEEDLIISKEYQERLKDGQIRLEVEDPIGYGRYLMLVARNGYPCDITH